MLFRPQLARFLKNVIKKEELIDVGEGKKCTLYIIHLCQKLSKIRTRAKIL